MSELNDKSGNQQPIEPIEVTLTDPNKLSKIAKSTPSRRLLLTVVASASLTLIMLWVFQEPNPLPQESTENTPPSQIETPSTTRESRTQSVAPFESLAKQTADQKAKVVISEYMAIEKRLNNEIFIDQALNPEILKAEELALAGDKLYYSEQYDEALAQYDQATETLKALVSSAESKFDSLLKEARQGLTDQQTETAKRSISEALFLKPGSETAKRIEARIALLPQIIDLSRDAKNDELAGNYKNALDTYEQIKQIDPLTSQINETIATVTEQVRLQQVQELLTNGFKLLESESFELARRAFQQVLDLDSENQTARSGLEQIAVSKDLFTIKEKNSVGKIELSSGKWENARQTYEEILLVDSNIQTAIEGRNLAISHQRVEDLLTKINAEPFKLSSEKLFLEAQAILREAQDLEFQTGKLVDLIERTSKLLSVYAEPVDVVLLSDNATDILISNVGRIGKFQKKIVSLRPGRYTIRGSQIGCKDIYRTIDVSPEYNSVTLVCEERLN